MHFGAHIGRRKTLIETLDEIVRVGGTALQIFASSPRVGKITPAIRERFSKEAPAIKARLRRDNLAIYIHTAYTLNLSSSESYVPATIRAELEIADEIGAAGVVVHTGRWVTAGSPEAGLKQMTENIRKILEGRSSRKGAKLILETASGQGSELLADPRELAAYVKQFPGLGICVDTAHVFAAGYDPQEALTQALRRVLLLQLNNSAVDKGSRVDRHAGILDKTARIPIKDLEETVRIAKYKNIDVILETPGGYAKEIPWISNIK